MSDERIETPRVVQMVARRELRERLRARSFAVATGLLVVLIIGIGVAARLAGGDDPDALEVGLVGEVPAAFEQAVSEVASLFDRQIELTPFDAQDAARTAVVDDEVDAALLADSAEVVFRRSVDQQLMAILQQSLAAVEVRAGLTEAGLEPQEIEDALATTTLEATIADEDGGDRLLANVTGTLAGILLFIALQTFGTYVLTGVVEEKSTAVIELLLVRARGAQLLAGKVIGIGIAAMIQLTLAVGAALVALAISGIEVPAEIWTALPMALVWFLLGYALYSTLFALAGSLVSRQEDAQAAAMPIMVALFAAYMTVFLFGSDPESTASAWLSILPPIAPLLMPMRMAAGAASGVEIAVSLALLTGSVAIAWIVTGRIYEQVLLQRGTRIGWRSAASLLRSG